ncbi:FxsA family protein [Alteromonas sp. ASW11-36]|uniref:FxsA family protein n=1 Tax=Alteromonas arenosi TaxID=3055817 RepID=A0ABT7T173_9ALTE|nr:FxsA family protein [Alteromonas sp. ASW11-36]MDM7862194.1 FxsA family protein [Alteromonas sp. ASW11-36]
MGILFLLFAVMPIVEIALLIQVGGVIGGWNTVAIVIVTAFIGAYLVRREGLSTLQAAQQKMNQGQMPGEELAQGLLLLVAGVLLVTPGFVTDFIGLLFTVPVTRKLIGKALLVKLLQSKHATVQFSHTQQFHQHYQARNKADDGDIIEGEYHAHDEQNKPQLPNEDKH